MEHKFLRVQEQEKYKLEKCNTKLGEIRNEKVYLNYLQG
jgi:hypothetical protein